MVSRLNARSHALLAYDSFVRSLEWSKSSFPHRYQPLVREYPFPTVSFETIHQPFFLLCLSVIFIHHLFRQTARFVQVSIFLTQIRHVKFLLVAINHQVTRSWYVLVATDSIAAV